MNRMFYILDVSMVPHFALVRPAMAASPAQALMESMSSQMAMAGMVGTYEQAMNLANRMPLSAMATPFPCAPGVSGDIAFAQMFQAVMSGRVLVMLPEMGGVGAMPAGMFRCEMPAAAVGMRATRADDATRSMGVSGTAPATGSPAHAPSTPMSPMGAAGGMNTSMSGAVDQAYPASMGGTQNMAMAARAGMRLVAFVMVPGSPGSGRMLVPVYEPAEMEPEAAMNDSLMMRRMPDPSAMPDGTGRGGSAPEVSPPQPNGLEVGVTDIRAVRDGHSQAQAASPHGGGGGGSGSGGAARQSAGRATNQSDRQGDDRNRTRPGTGGRVTPAAPGKPRRGAMNGTH